MAIVVQLPGNAPSISTCTPWASMDDLPEPCASANFPVLMTLDCLQAASDILFYLSGSQFPGSCLDTVRPVGRWSLPDGGRPINGYMWGPYGWTYYPMMTGPGLGGAPNVDCVPAVSLGVYPLTSIVEVKIDGQTVDPKTYRIDDNRYLVRLVDPATGQNDGWPTSQDMDRPDTEPGTWSVTMTYGTPPPPGGKLAAAELGCQLSLAMNPATAGQCQLPQRVTQVTRQGVTAVVLDPMSFLEKGKTGLYMVDLFLKSVNPGGLRRRATISNPDVGRRVRRSS